MNRKGDRRRERKGTPSSKRLSLSLTERLCKANPVRNSSVALKPGEMILKCNPAAEQRGIISNGVRGETHDKRFGKHIKAGSADPR